MELNEINPDSILEEIEVLKAKRDEARKRYRNCTALLAKFELLQQIVDIMDLVRHSDPIELSSSESNVSQKFRARMHTLKIDKALLEDIK